MSVNETIVVTVLESMRGVTIPFRIRMLLPFSMLKMEIEKGLQCQLKLARAFTDTSTKKLAPSGPFRATPSSSCSAPGC